MVVPLRNKKEGKQNLQSCIGKALGSYDDDDDDDDHGDGAEMGGVYRTEEMQEIVALMCQTQDLGDMGLSGDRRLSTNTEKTGKQYKDSKSKRFSCEQQK